MTQETMSEAEFARHRRVSKTSVCNWKKLGHLVWEGDRIRVDASCAVLDARPPRYAHKGAKVKRYIGAEPSELNDDVNMTTAEAQRRKEVALALTREINLAILQGKIILTEDVEPAMMRIVLAARTHMLGVPCRAQMLLQLTAMQTEGLKKLIHEGLRAASTADVSLPNGEAPHAAKLL